MTDQRPDFKLAKRLPGSSQIAACAECQRYKDHPIQRGICDLHRKPIYERERHDDHQQRTLIYRAKDKARAALSPQSDTGKSG